MVQDKVAPSKIGIETAYGRGEVTPPQFDDAKSFTNEGGPHPEHKNPLA